MPPATPSNPGERGQAAPTPEGQGTHVGDGRRTAAPTADELAAARAVLAGAPVRPALLLPLPPVRPRSGPAGAAAELAAVLEGARARLLALLGSPGTPAVLS